MCSIASRKLPPQSMFCSQPSLRLHGIRLVETGTVVSSTPFFFAASSFFSAFFTNDGNDDCLRGGCDKTCHMKPSQKILTSCDLHAVVPKCHPHRLVQDGLFPARQAAFALCPIIHPNRRTINRRIQKFDRNDPQAVSYVRSHTSAPLLPKRAFHQSNTSCTFLLGCTKCSVHQTSQLSRVTSSVVFRFLIAAGRKTESGTRTGYRCCQETSHFGEIRLSTMPGR